MFAKMALDPWSIYLQKKLRLPLRYLHIASHIHAKTSVVVSFKKIGLFRQVAKPAQWIQTHTGVGFAR